MNKNEIKAVANSIRSLSMDAIQKANSGHPGLPLGAAEAAAVLYGEILKHNPSNSKWVDRDRFVLSAGHGSMLLYSALHLSGYKVTIDDIKSFRQLGSKCTGHPEYGVTDGVENTSGPLGQGVAMAVGMAVAENMLAARFNTSEHKIVDHYTYSLVGEGCLQEGVSSEACSLAGHLKLGKLIVFYDENRISIDGSTDITFTEDIAGRYKAYGWQVLKGSMYEPEEIIKLVEEAKKCTDKPSLIMLKSVIGLGSPKAGTADVHGAPLGEAGIKSTKNALGLPEDKEFYVIPEAYKYFEQKKEYFASLEEEWNKKFEQWSSANPQLRKKWDNFHNGIPQKELPSSIFNALEKTATRNASGKMLNIIADCYENLVGGSADLAGPNKTAIKNDGGIYSSDNPKGRTIEFGIREFAMSAICSGISLHGGLRAFCATFLVFSDYLRPQLRIAALMKLPLIYVFTHDSIFVGEDGPTHQPIETLASIRMIPGVKVLRPGDAEETEYAWKYAMSYKDGPICIVLTRQDIQGYEKDDKNWKENIKKGAYIVKTGSSSPDITILAGGSEVSTAITAAALVPEKNIRILSVLDLKKFMLMNDAERNELIGKPKRIIAAEAGVGTEWMYFVKNAEDLFCINQFGESAPAAKVAEYLGFMPEKLAELLRKD